MELKGGKIMSISASIDVKFVTSEDKGNSIGGIVIGLLNNGWTLNDNGKISYLPVGDDGDYNWVSESINIDELINILDEKERRNESIGVSLTWGDTNIGGTLLIWDKESLSFNLSINRKIINQDSSMGITDVNWYLEKLISGLINEKFKVESFSFKQSY